MIRNAEKEDAEKILAIYSYYVKNTAISFELDVPSLDEFHWKDILISFWKRRELFWGMRMPVFLKTGPRMTIAVRFPFMWNDMQKDAVTAECFTRRLRLR